MSRNCIAYFVLLAAVLASGGVRVEAQPLVHQLDGFSSVDWRRSVVHAFGSGGHELADQDRTKRIEALESAKDAAARNLLKAVQQLSLNASWTVRSAMQKQSLLAIKVRSFVQRYQVTDTRSMSDMSVEVDVELPINNGLAELFIPDVTGRGKFRLDDIPRSPLSLLPWPECRPVPEGIKLVIASEGLVSYEGEAYTGLILDARGLEVKPAILPRILDENGEEVYGLNYVRRKKAVEQGMVSYKWTMKEALRDRRAGKKPLLICAAGKSGRLQSDLIVSANDAVLIHAAAKTQNFLKLARVILVIGSK
ncbi:MAG: hypothetical protein ACE5IY_13065 [bacterium]